MPTKKVRTRTKKRPIDFTGDVPPRPLSTRFYTVSGAELVKLMADRDCWKNRSGCQQEVIDTMNKENLAVGEQLAAANVRLQAASTRADEARLREEQASTDGAYSMG